MMKRINVLLVMFVCVIMVFIIGQPKNVVASNTDIPYQTYSIGLYGELVNTAVAYEGTFILNAGFMSPQDIYIDKEDIVYIADSGNGRIYIYNPVTGEERVIGNGILQNPTGVFVDKQKDIYVADAKLNKVFWFNQDGELIKEYNRPTETFFGETATYQPRKVVVNDNKDVYIISEGGNNGIILLNKDGEFLGYYGTNKVNLSFGLYLRRMFMSKEQRQSLASLIPKPSHNLAIDNKGIIYTITTSKKEEQLVDPLKKLNIEGNNILSGNYIFSKSYQDVFIDDKGLIYVVCDDAEAPAIISVLDKSGFLIFAFGTKRSGSLKIGQFESPSGIAVDSNGDIWVLDKAGNNVQVFTKTEFANLVLTAIDYHDKSQYDKSSVLFKEVIKQNAMFALAHSSLGKAYEREGNWEKSLESYRIANDKFGYSNVYWEVRDNWIADNLLITLVIIGIVWLALYFLNKYKHSIKGYDVIHAKIENIKNTQTYHEIMLMPRVLRNPNDVVYEIKFRQSVRIRTAIVLYVIFVFFNIITSHFILGYLFRSLTQEIVLSYEIMKILLPLLLIGISNHLINSLQSGEGFYRDIFIGVIYACAPIFIFKLPLDIISNVLTYNEAFIMNLGYLIMYGWTGINLILMIKEINNYKPGQLILNLLLTAFTMLIIIIIYLVLNVLATQAWSFFEGLFKEVFLQ
ncbi:MAG: hypothetical protein GX490_10525 [Bacilli bacterium]|nr:hypothetical protein [Bacilli bacterium]